MLIGPPMPTCSRGAVVRVPFPYTDRPVRQHRPALVVAVPGAVERDRDDGVALVWVVMITSAANRRWEDDIDADPGDRSTGLPVPSIVRVRKIATVDEVHAEVIGRLSDGTMRRVIGALERLLAA